MVPNNYQSPAKPWGPCRYSTSAVGARSPGDARRADRGQVDRNPLKSCRKCGASDRIDHRSINNKYN
jgi:hypothetical protein